MVESKEERNEGERERKRKKEKKRKGENEKERRKKYKKRDRRQTTRESAGFSVELADQAFMVRFFTQNFDPSTEGSDYFGSIQ